MSETNNTKNVREDEIDLLDLFKRMGRSIGKMGRAIGKALLISIVFLLRNWLPLGLSVVLGVGISYLLKFASPSFYTSDLVLRTNAIPTADLISYVNRLHTYCKEGNTEALKVAISIPDNQIKNINDITALWIIDLNKDGIPDEVDLKGTHNVYDTLNIRMTDRFNIRVRINSPQELINLQSGIIGYINSDSLFQQRNRLRIRQNEELLTRLGYDIEQLDSLQKVKYFEETRNRQPQNGGQMIFLQEQKTQLVYSDIYALYTRKQFLETEKEIYSDIVTILSDFSIPALRVNGGGYYAVRVVPFLFFLTLLAVILIANRKKLTEVYHKY